MSTRKRSRDYEDDAVHEFESLSGSLLTPTKVGKLHGFITNLSPMKESAKKKLYFEGEVTDSSGCARFVGFDENQLKTMNTLKNEKQAVSLEICEVKKSPYSEKMEVTLTRRTKIGSSSRKLEFPESSLAAASTVMADCKNIRDMAPFQIVPKLAVKVIKVNSPLEVKSDLRKQDVFVADGVGCVKVTMWQDDINTLQLGQSYYLKNMSVRHYNNEKYLTTSKSFAIEAMNEPLDNVVDLPEDGFSNEADSTELKNVEVVAVSQISVIRVCISCKGNVTTVNRRIGRCEGCKCSVRLEKCKVMVRCDLIVDEEGKNVSLKAFGSVIEDIVGVKIGELLEESVESINESILLATPFSLVYAINEKVITSIFRN